MKAEDLRDFKKQYNPANLTEADRRYPFVGGFRRYINNLLPAVSHVTDNETVNFAVPDFYERLDRLMSATPPRTMANYVFWRAVADTTEMLSDQPRAYQQKFKQALHGNSKIQERWLECFELMENT